MTANWFRQEFEKAKAFNAALPPYARLVVSAPVTSKENAMTNLATDPASVPAATASAEDATSTALTQALHDHAPDFDGDGDAGWITCTCEATFPSGIPGDLADWWNHFNAQLLGLCIACGNNNPDGPTDSNGDKWCDACSDAASAG